MLKGQRQVAISLPALLGVALVLVYIFGVLNAAGSFAKAGIPQTALRQLSVEQLLIRGISILAQPGVTLAILVVGGSVVTIELSNRRVRGPLSPARRLRLRRVGIWGGLLLLFLIAATSLFSSWEVAVALAPLVIVPVVAILNSKRGLVHTTRRLHLLYAPCSLATLLLASYFLPLPQPSICIHRSSALCLSGVLVTHVDAVWYIWQNKTDEVAAVPDSATEKVSVFYPGAEAGRSPAEMLMGLLP